MRSPSGGRRHTGSRGADSMNAPPFYTCACGRVYPDTATRGECELAGHYVNVVASEPAPDVETILAAVSDTTLITIVRSVTLGDRIPFRHLLRELSARLENANANIALLSGWAQTSSHGTADPKDSDEV